MRNKITMEMSICQAENGFSLDELVKKFADAFENKAFADILKMNLQLTQEVLMYRIFNNSSTEKNVDKGIALLTEASGSEDTDDHVYQERAMRLLSETFENGNGVEKDEEAAFDWKRKADELSAQNRNHK